MSEKTQTIDYYNANFENFISGTLNLDFSSTQDRFLSLLPAGAKILDFGCGSGRDSLYFKKHGFQVTATDGCLNMCRAASETTGLTVRHMLFCELDESGAYDGIWACASILHMPELQLHDVFQKMKKALKSGGIIYTSFKYGTFRGIRNGRYFCDFTRENMLEFLKMHPDLSIVEMWQTGDIRTDHRNEQWLNMLLRLK